MRVTIKMPEEFEINLEAIYDDDGMPVYSDPTLSIDYECIECHYEDDYLVITANETLQQELAEIESELLDTYGIYNLKIINTVQFYFDIGDVTDTLIDCITEQQVTRRLTIEKCKCLKHNVVKCQQVSEGLELPQQDIDNYTDFEPALYENTQIYFNVKVVK